MADVEPVNNSVVDAVTLPTDFRVRVQAIAAESNTTVSETIIRLAQQGERCQRQKHDDK